MFQSFDSLLLPLILFLIEAILVTLDDSFLAEGLLRDVVVLVERVITIGAKKHLFIETGLTALVQFTLGEQMCLRLLAEVHSGSWLLD